MTKSKEDIKAFAWHLCSLEAIRDGWDMEADMGPVLAQRVATENDPVMYSAGSADVHLSDWVAAMKGEHTERFMQFWRTVHRSVEAQVANGKEWPDVLLVSMHSGSSDYFTKEMLFDLVAPCSPTS